MAKPGTFVPGDPRINRKGRPPSLLPELKKRSKDGIEFLENLLKVARGEVLWTQEVATAKGELVEIDVRPSVAEFSAANRYLYERIEGPLPKAVEVSGSVDHQHTHEVGERMAKLRELPPEKLKVVLEARRILSTDLPVSGDASAEDGFQCEPARAELPPATDKGVVDAEFRAAPAPDPAPLGSTGRESVQEDRTLAHAIASAVSTEGHEDAESDLEEDPFGGD